MRALAVRPYGDAIRRRVILLLEAAGVHVEIPAELDGDVDDGQVVMHLQRRRADVLLVPFHAVRTDAGDRSNGLQLLHALRERVPWTRHVPVIMPISQFAEVAFDRLVSQHDYGRLFAVREGDLDAAAGADALAKFLGAEIA